MVRAHPERLEELPHTARACSRSLGKPVMSLPEGHRQVEVLTVPMLGSCGYRLQKGEGLTRRREGPKCVSTAGLEASQTNWLK